LNNSSKKGKTPRDIGFYILVVVIALSVVWLLASRSTPSALEVKYSTVRRLFMDDKVETFTLEGNILTIKLKTKDTDLGTDLVTNKLYSVSIFYEDNREYIDEKLESDSEDFYDLIEGFQMPWWFSIIPYLAVLVVFIFIYNMMINRSGVGGDKGAMRFGKARTKLAGDEKKKVTFADVAGADEEKAELAEIVDFLKGPDKYIKLGARIPKGVLLVGPPGTGKTLIARAVAGEAGTQFLSISGSDFVELYVGVGASRVRDLFDQAKKLAPAIIFIDEIDAVGRQRGAGLGGGHDEREQTLNQLLVEMDGFTANEGVIIIAATNRSDILDSALLRPGRFDRQVYVGLPDIKGREEILKVHSKGKILSNDVNLANIAKSTTGFTGADLENLLNEAALLAARKNKRAITMQDIEESTLKVIAGPEKKSRVVTEKDRKLTAFHEAGHAVVSYFLDHHDAVQHITIIPHGQAGGMTVYRPEDDKSFQSRSEMFERIVSALGGRIAEKLMLDDISSGASSDIQSASAIARAMVTQYGMSDAIGPISFDDSSHSVFIGRDYQQRKGYSEKTAALIDDEVKHIFDEAVEKCEQVLLENKDLLTKTAEYLLDHETMDGEQFKFLCKNGYINAPVTPVSGGFDADFDTGFDDPLAEFTADTTAPPAEQTE
jgi:cell division protease FtsH